MDLEKVALQVSNEFRSFLSDFERGKCWDRAAIERFSSSLKTMRTARKVCRSRGDARANVFDFVERCHNLLRELDQRILKPHRLRGEAGAPLIRPNRCPANPQQFKMLHLCGPRKGQDADGAPVKHVTN